MLAVIQIVTALFLALEFSCQLAASEIVSDMTLVRGPASVALWNIVLGLGGAVLIGTCNYFVVLHFLPAVALKYALMAAGIAFCASLGYALVEICRTHHRAAYLRRRAHLIAAFLLDHFDAIRKPGKEAITLKDLFEARKLTQSKAELGFLKVAGAELAAGNTVPVLSREALCDLVPNLERKYSRW